MSAGGAEASRRAPTGHYRRRTNQIIPIATNTTTIAMTQVVPKRFCHLPLVPATSAHIVAIWVLALKFRLGAGQMQACWPFPRSRTPCRNVRTKQTKHTKSGVRTASPAKRRSFCLRAQVMANVQSSGAHVIWPGMASDWCLFDRPLEPCYAPSIPASRPAASPRSRADGSACSELDTEGAGGVRRPSSEAWMDATWKRNTQYISTKSPNLFTRRFATVAG